MLTEVWEKIKLHLEPIKNDAFAAAVVILVAVISFGLGRLSAVYEQKTPITIEYLDSAKGERAAGDKLPAYGQSGGQTMTSAAEFVASKNGAKYYPKDCTAASRIKEENKIWFGSPEEAEQAGYEPAASCQ